jgi:hypothetical protein
MPVISNILRSVDVRRVNLIELDVLEAAPAS